MGYKRRLPTYYSEIVRFKKLLLIIIELLTEELLLLIIVLLLEELTAKPLQWYTR